MREREPISEATQRAILWAASAIVTIAMMLAYAYVSDRDGNKAKQLKREAIIKCVERGKDPLMCEKAMQP